MVIYSVRLVLYENGQYVVLIRGFNVFACGACLDFCKIIKSAIITFGGIVDGGCSQSEFMDLTEKHISQNNNTKSR